MEEIWAAGFFDGEGSTGCYLQPDKRYKRICMSVTQIHKDTLQRFQKAVHRGIIVGPYIRKNKNASPQYSWRCDKYEDIKYVLKRMEPYLSIHKIIQANRAITDYEKYQYEMKERPDTCKRGHNDWKYYSNRRECAACRRFKGDVCSI